jgi:hypothetical protein
LIASVFTAGTQSAQRNFPTESITHLVLFVASLFHYGWPLI